MPAGMPPLPPKDDEFGDFADESPEPPKLPTLPRRNPRVKQAPVSTPPTDAVADRNEGDRVARGPLVVVAMKSVGISLILSFLFGPLGMLYSTFPAG